MFDPQPHLIQLPRKVKDKATGHWTTIYEDYLEVKWRLCWFRDRYPHGSIETTEVCVDLERGYARYRCVVEDGQSGRATGYGTETAADFADYCERAQLAMLTSKTARLVHDEGDRWVPLLHAMQAERAARLAKGRKVHASTSGEG